MKQMTSGTAALADMACWNIWKTRCDDHFTEFALHTGDKDGSDTAEVLTHVISELMGKRSVAVRVEGVPSSAPALAALENIWEDGRMLKRADGSAFVALADRLDEEELRTGLMPCVGADVAFCFMGFGGQVSADHAFRCLMGEEAGGTPALELTCADIEMGDLYIRMDAEQMDECDMLRCVRDAITGCGRFLQMEM